MGTCPLSLKIFSIDFDEMHLIAMQRLNLKMSKVGRWSRGQNLGKKSKFVDGSICRGLRIKNRVRSQNWGVQVAFFTFIDNN